MKLLCKAMLLTSVTVNPSYAGKVKIYYTGEQKEAALKVLERFRVNYEIPTSLLAIKRTSKCKSLDARFLELCLNEKGELKELSNINSNRIIKSLLTFKVSGETYAKN